MDCKEAQILLAPHIMGELDSDSRSHDLQVHLFSCQACSQEYEAVKETIEFIDEHKALFAEAFETIDKERAAEQEEIKRSWQAIQAKLVKIKAQEKRAKLRRVLWRATAAAACFVIGISVWLTLSNSKIPEKPIPQKTALAPAPSIKIDLVSDNGNVAISAGTEIKTTASEMKTLILNGKHHMLLNSDTALLIEPLLDNERVGCIVKLTSGEIFTHVKHDGNPFVVSTAHGKAIITGTTFDVKVTDTITTLVVSEGTVQFESEQGTVEVAPGQISRIVANSAPTKPVSCNTAELTAWATGYEIKTTLAKIKSFSEGYDLTDLWFSAMSGPIDLEAIDYKDWIEKKRDWFKREFPWIFQLKDSLAKEGVEVDYPELLIHSGDVWQFVYPDVSPARIPVLNTDSLLRAASRYGYDREWLVENVSTVKSVIDSPMVAKSKFTDLKAFEQWSRYFEDLKKSSMELDADTLLYSLHASTFLANTRTLAWLGIKNGKHVSKFKAEHETEVLVLLQTEVNSTNILTNKTIKLLLASCQNQPCDEYSQLMDDVIENIGEIMNIEKRILEYESHR